MMKEVLGALVLLFLISMACNWALLYAVQNGILSAIWR